jgi:hypothetical protein
MSKRTMHSGKCKAEKSQTKRAQPYGPRWLRGLIRKSSPEVRASMAGALGGAFTVMCHRTDATIALRLFDMLDAECQGIAADVYRQYLDDQRRRAAAVPA